MENNQQKHVDPSALGLFGLALVTLVASMQKFGIVENTLFVIPWAVFLGAAAQLLAGIMDYKKGNAFGGLAFVGYGVFWLGVAMTWSFSGGVIPAAVTGDSKALGFAFLGYLIFTLIMTVGSLPTNKVLTIIFVLIDFLFIGLTFSTLGILHGFMHYFAAAAEILIAAFSFYACAANILAIQFKKTVLPIGKPFYTFKEV